MTYDEAVKNTWDLDRASPKGEAEWYETLIRYATLTPSGHNTQCWRFRVEEGAISILPDLTRRTPVVDPDDHHLHVSLGLSGARPDLVVRVGRAPAMPRSLRRPVGSVMRERALLPFLLITFTIAWGILAGYLFLNAPMSLVFGPITGHHTQFYLAVYAPAIAALLVVFHGEGPGGVRRLLGRLLLWRAPRLVCVPVEGAVTAVVPT
ncbi:hypothetical protein KG088_01260 [Halomonas sp. TRM85114]|uniref:hypothetical protein n=1 Tax=Halomonas jincaotanensis TaxID=2810616 RepID=UPI001BD40DA7|nr:hypothetical protein [Halomonas jincaotanensis]MBS9402255.1 hypothetical protein [Halomonas jincaotanensis]